MRVIAVAIVFALAPGMALAANCKRNGNTVICDDGRTGIFAGDAIVWPDGTRSSSARHPSVHIGHKDSVPLDDPNALHKRDCAVLDGVSYCH
jgi:hypothetical protein